MERDELLNSSEVIKTEIARYMELLRISRDNGDVKNNALTDAITESRVTLETLGINVGGLVLS